MGTEDDFAPCETCGVHKQKARDLLIEMHKLMIGWAFATGCSTPEEYQAKELKELIG